MTDDVKLVGVTVNREYTVRGAEQVPDNSGCPIAPEVATVRFLTRAGQDSPLLPHWITIEGRRTRGAKTTGHMSQGGYMLGVDGSVVPDTKHGDPPAWVAQLVARAVAEQNGQPS